MPATLPMFSMAIAPKFPAISENPIIIAICRPMKLQRDSWPDMATTTWMPATPVKKNSAAWPIRRIPYFFTMTAFSSEATAIPPAIIANPAGRNSGRLNVCWKMG